MTTTVEYAQMPDQINDGAGYDQMVEGSNGSSYKKRSCSRKRLMADKSIRSADRYDRQWRPLPTVHITVHGWSAI